MILAAKLILFATLFDLIDHKREKLKGPLTFHDAYNAPNSVSHPLLIEHYSLDTLPLHANKSLPSYNLIA